MGADITRILFTDRDRYLADNSRCLAESSRCLADTRFV